MISFLFREWNLGFVPKYGLQYVNFSTPALDRTYKLSFFQVRDFFKAHLSDWLRDEGWETPKPLRIVIFVLSLVIRRGTLACRTPACVYVYNLIYCGFCVDYSGCYLDEIISPLVLREKQKYIIAVWYHRCWRRATTYPASLRRCISISEYIWTTCEDWSGLW